MGNTRSVCCDSGSGGRRQVGSSRIRRLVLVSGVQLNLTLFFDLTGSFGSVTLDAPEAIVVANGTARCVAIQTSQSMGFWRLKVASKNLAYKDIHEEQLFSTYMHAYQGDHNTEE